MSALQTNLKILNRKSSGSLWTGPNKTKRRSDILCIKCEAGCIMMASPVSTTLDHQRTFLDKLNRTYKLLVQNVRSIHFDFFKMQLLTFQLPKSDHSFSPLHIYLHQSQVIRISVRSRQELLCEEFVHSRQLSEFVLILMSYWIISYTINFKYRSQRVKGLNHAVASLVLFVRQNTLLEKNVFYLVTRSGQRYS